MTLFELLPSLKAAGRPRFDPLVWPAGAGFRLGRLIVDGTCVEDYADCHGTPSAVGGVVIARVRSVIAGIVTVDADCDVTAAEIANRHSVAGREMFALGDTKVELPADVRAGDVLALISKT